MRLGSLIPLSHTRLLKSTVDVTLTTISPQGYPESTLVWCSLDDKYVLLNTGVGYKKERNIRKNSHVSIFSFDPDDKLFWIEVQGDAELIPEGASEHLNKLSFAYTGKSDFYRDVMPELKDKEERVIIRVTPKKVKVGKGVPILPQNIKNTD